MIQRVSIEISSPDSEDGPGNFRKASCRAFRKLKNWQIEQYRKAVDENKWYMNERLGRIVGWKEAEADFLQHGYYGCAPKWRREYCSCHCGFFTSCDLGQQFCNES